MASLFLLVCSGCETKRADVAPDVEGLAPATSKGPAHDYQLTVRHRSGGGAVKNVQLMFGSDMTGVSACWAEYSAPQQTFRLMSDNAKEWREAPTPGAEIANSQCTLTPAKSKATVDGERVTVTFSLRFSPQLTGPRTASGIASAEAVHSGWKSVGKWEGP